MKTLYLLFLLFAAFCLGGVYQSGEWGAPLAGLVGAMLAVGVAAVTGGDHE